MSVQKYLGLVVMVMVRPQITCMNKETRNIHKYNNKKKN
jgi:hypothetical protein